MSNLEAVSVLAICSRDRQTLAEMIFGPAEVSGNIDAVDGDLPVSFQIADLKAVGGGTTLTRQMPTLAHQCSRILYPDLLPEIS